MFSGSDDNKVIGVSVYDCDMKFTVCEHIEKLCCYHDIVYHVLRIVSQQAAPRLSFRELSFGEELIREPRNKSSLVTRSVFPFISRV